MSRISLAWADFKVIAATNKAKMRLVERALDAVAPSYPFYYMTFSDSGGLFETSVLKDGGADQTDVETNFLPYANKNADSPADSDLSVLTRPKITALGWTMQDHYFEFALGTLASTGLYSKNAAGTDFGFSTMRFYESVAGVETLIAGGNELSQTYLTANAIRTDVLWEMTNDIDVISGELRFAADITVDVRMWVVVVPDVPALYGGSKELITGGRNLRMIQAKTPFFIEGRTVKHLVYDATYHTNKFQMVYRHPAGFNDTISMTIGLYKA
jgi:hypothetical protein